MNNTIKPVRLLTALFFGCVLQLSVFAQHTVKSASSVNTSAAATREADIAAISAEYSRIKQLPLKKTTFKFESSGCVDNGVITYFQDNGEIVKITYSGFIGDGSWITEYYFQSGKLIFCYDNTVGGAAAEPLVTDEYRLYVKNDKPIRSMKNKKIVGSGDKATQNIKDGYNILKAYKTKNFIAALCND